MPWEETPIDENFQPVGEIPKVERVDVKVEDWHRTDMPGCPRHRTAGAIMQHTSWTDPDGTKHNRFTGYSICAECSALVDFMDAKSY